MRGRDSSVSGRAGVPPAGFRVPRRPPGKVATTMNFICTDLGRMPKSAGGTPALPYETPLWQINRVPGNQKQRHHHRRKEHPPRAARDATALRNSTAPAGLRDADNAVSRRSIPHADTPIANQAAESETGRRPRTTQWPDDRVKFHRPRAHESARAQPGISRLGSGRAELHHPRYCAPRDRMTDGHVNLNHRRQAPRHHPAGLSASLAAGRERAREGKRFQRSAANPPAPEHALRHRIEISTPCVARARFEKATAPRPAHPRPRHSATVRATEYPTAPPERAAVCASGIACSWICATLSASLH